MIEVNKHFERELRRHGLRLVSADPLQLACEQCGAKWSPNALPGGRLPRHWWKCYNGCEAKGKT
jgi:hypothetical protein